MKKIIKKIVAVATTLSLTAAMGVMAFAAPDSYTFVGNPIIFGGDSADITDYGWVTTAEEQKFADAGDGYFTAKFKCATAGEYEYKVVADGDIFAWAYQMALGNPDSAWADNQTQFKAAFEAGEYTAVLNPSQGLVVIVQNGKVLDFTVRYNSKDEDPEDFVEPNVKAITDKGFSPKDFEGNLASLKTKALELAGGSAAEDPTTAAPAADTTTKAPEATTPSKPVQTGDVAPVAIILSLLGAVAVVAFVAKKKEA